MMAGFQHPHITTVLAWVRSLDGTQSGLLMPRALHALSAVVECALATTCSSPHALQLDPGICGLCYVPSAGVMSDCQSALASLQI